MDTDFWLQRWETNKIGFHGSETNPRLVEHVEALSLAKGSRMFVPLCGKTLDIGWLLAQGYRVAGAELSETAIEQLFAELGVAPAISSLGRLKRYSTDGVDVFVGDVFELSGEVLGPVDGIYDRAALVALPEAVRRRYAAHLVNIAARAPQLLLCFEYDQQQMAGPPFSVDRQEVMHCYGDVYDLELMGRAAVTGGLKGTDAAESVWLLRRG